ncbi:MAG: SIR2 family protein, partial [Desulfobacterales bacterium]|nr:SIR2 family protein [Desulfobacterales bacterium]
MEEEKQRAVWSRYEYNRMLSRNVLPRISFYFIAKLCSLNLVKSIITTNYDSFILSIFRRDQTLPRPVVNPVLRKGEDSAGYRSSKRSRKLRIYFLHGSFDWARFNKCGHIVALPGWAIGTNLWRVPTDWAAEIYHDQLPPDRPHATGPAEHFIDWNVGRKPFQKEVDQACAEINLAVKNGGILLLLGFRGTHCPHIPTWHEEISKPIADAADKIPVFMVISKDQVKDSERDKVNGPTADELGWLLNQIETSRYGKLEKVLRIEDWFMTSLQGSGIDPAFVEMEY